MLTRREAQRWKGTWNDSKVVRMTDVPHSFLQLPNAVEVTVTIDAIEPEVWRQLLVPRDSTLAELHAIIQAAFNWGDCHLHSFDIGGLTYGDPEDNEDGHTIFDEHAVRLSDFGTHPETEFTYLYDWGDNWRHTVKLGQSCWLDAVPKGATLLAGGNARPPEDVGGTERYRWFLTVMADHSHPEHREMKAWCGGHFDPSLYDHERIARDLRTALRQNRRRSLHQPRPNARL